MNPLKLVFHAMRAMINIPFLLLLFMWNLVLGRDDALAILQQQLPRQLYLVSPVAYVVLMVIAQVTLLTSDGITSVALQLLVATICNLWIFVTISLGVQAYDTRLVQAQSIQYYLLFVGFLQTVAWVVHPENPKNEPSSVLILFLATAVAFVNEKLIKPNIEMEAQMMATVDMNQPMENNT